MAINTDTIACFKHEMDVFNVAVHIFVFVVYFTRIDLFSSIRF